jgi:hypothetical protein
MGLWTAAQWAPGGPTTNSADDLATDIPSDRASTLVANRFVLARSFIVPRRHGMRRAVVYSTFTNCYGRSVLRGKDMD